MNLIALALNLTLTYAGMLMICLGMARHWKQLTSPRIPAELRRACVPTGVLFLALAAYTCSFVWDTGMAWVAWFGMSSLGGLMLLMLLPYAPRLALWLPIGGGLVCVVLNLN